MAGPENNKLAKNWLVKSSTKILGPFTREEVMLLLTRRQITVIDEVRQPEGRWNYIRDNRFFKEVVKSLRYEQDHSKEDTMTSTSTVGTSSMTKTEAPTIADEFTPTPVITSKAQQARDQVPGMKDVTPGGVESVPQANGGPAKIFGTLADQRVQNKIQQQNVMLRGILLAVAALAIVFVGFTYLRKEKKTDVSYDQLVKSALRYKELGLYELSLQNYKKAAAIREPDLESQFQMVFLLINEDRQSLNGRRVIERALLKEGRLREEIISANLGMALSYMMEGDLRQAEDYLQKTLGFDANNENAKINQAIILLKKGNYAQALKLFEGLSRPESPVYPLVLLCKAMALVETSKNFPNIDFLGRKITEIKTYVGKSHFLRKELSLMLIYLNQLYQEPAGVESAIASFLEEPPSLSRLYARDLTVDWRNSEWDYLERYCSELYNSGKGPDSMKAVRAVCLIESNREIEATKFLNEVLAQRPLPLASLQAQAQHLVKLGRSNEAQILFKNSEFKQDPLALYTQGEACLNAKDLPCAEVAYKLLADRDYGDVIAHYGLARVAELRKDKVSMQAEIKAGFESETRFAPLIELRDKAESP